jgi:hypothetical protein
MRIAGVAAAAAAVVFSAAAVSRAWSRPDLEEAREKRRMAEGLLADLEREIHERTEEERKFKILKDALYDRWEQRVDEKEKLKPDYLMARMPGEIRDMERQLRGHIREMETDRAAWEAKLATERRKAADLWAKAQAAPGEVEAAKLRAEAEESARSAESIEALLPEIVKDVEKARSLLGE